MDNQLAKLIKEQREEFRGFIPDMMVGERIMTTRRLKEVHSETTTALLKEVIKMVEEHKKGYQGLQYKYGKEALTDHQNLLQEALDETNK
tara:strand:+ start:4813 stop:5082 length:270 start_codon:yes stop_codon:yes gene_type:complete